MSKHNSKEKIEKSIDSILGSLTIRGRDEEKDQLKEMEKLKKKLEAYEQYGSLPNLKIEIEQLNDQRRALHEERAELLGEIKEQQKQLDLLLNEIKGLSRQKEQFQKEIDILQGQLPSFQVPDKGTYHKDKKAYQPSPIIRQYCEQPEGKRKLTIHLREIDYQAILKASRHLHSNKGQLMDTITKALRFYISGEDYIEAEREVLLKAIQSVRSVLEDMGFSTEDIEQRLRRDHPSKG